MIFVLWELDFKNAVRNFFKYRIKMAVLFICAMLLMNKGYSQGKRIFDSLETAYKTLKKDSAKFENIFDQIRILRYHDPELTMKKCWILYHLALKSNSEHVHARAFVQLGIQYRKAGNYDTAIVLYMRALQIFDEWRKAIPLNVYWKIFCPFRPQTGRDIHP